MAKKTTTPLLLSDLQRAIIQAAGQAGHGMPASSIQRDLQASGVKLRLTVLEHMLEELVQFNFLSAFPKAVYGARCHTQLRYRATILGYEAIANTVLAIEL